MAEIPAAFHDLLRAPGIATLTTNGADGYPQSTALWYHFDGEVIRILMQASTRKAKNLQRDPRCTFLLIDPNDSHRVIEVRADADLTVEQGNDRPLSTMILANYGTSWDRMSNVDAPRVIATLRPVRINTVG